MTVTDLPLSPAEPRGGNVAVAIFVTATFIPAVVAIAVFAILNGLSDDSTGSEDAYVRQVAERVYVIERDRQAFIDAGRDLCGIAGEHAAAASRQVLIDHGLSDYATDWAVVSTAAAGHLC